MVVNKRSHCIRLLTRTSKLGGWAIMCFFAINNWPATSHQLTFKEWHNQRMTQTKLSWIWVTMPQSRCVLSKGLMMCKRCKQCNRGVHSPWCEVETPTKTHLGVDNRSSCIFCSQVYINNTKSDILHQVFILEKKKHKVLLAWGQPLSWFSPQEQAACCHISLKSGWRGYEKLFCAVSTQEG